jgi:hypothetical protein
MNGSPQLLFPTQYWAELPNTPASLHHFVQNADQSRIFVVLIVHTKRDFQSLLQERLMRA